jgi:hypothetical protein
VPLRLVGSEMCIRDRNQSDRRLVNFLSPHRNIEIKIIKRTR